MSFVLANYMYRNTLSIFSLETETMLWTAVTVVYEVDKGAQTNLLKTAAYTEEAIQSAPLLGMTPQVDTSPFDQLQNVEPILPAKRFDT